MLADPRADSLARNFGFQWLNLAKLAEIDARSRDLPVCQRRRRPARGLPQGDRACSWTTSSATTSSVLELLTLDVHLPQRAARAALRHQRGVRGDQFRQVKLADPRALRPAGQGRRADGQRLSRTAPRRCCAAPSARAHHGHAAAAAAARMSRRCRTTSARKKPATVRERIEDASPASRSATPAMRAIDPLGFALENFDATGKCAHASTASRARAIDTRAKLPDGTVVRRPDELREALLADPDQFVQNVTEKLMMYALGRTHRGTRHAGRARHRARGGRATTTGSQRSSPTSCTSDAFHEGEGARRRSPPAVPTAAVSQLKRPAMYITRKHLSRRTVLRGAGAPSRCRCWMR